MQISLTKIALNITIEEERRQRIHCARKNKSVYKEASYACYY